jgi:hypothetical protein
MDNNGEPFDDKMKHLALQLFRQMDDAAVLDVAIADNLKAIGYGK